jgi:hypothetical protein
MLIEGKIKYTILYCASENFCDSILLRFRFRYDKKLWFRLRSTVSGMPVRKSNEAKQWFITQHFSFISGAVSMFMVKIAVWGSLKRVTGRIFSPKLLSNFKGSSKNFELIFSLTKKHKLVKTISAYTESTYLLLYAFKKHSSRVTVPLIS